MTPRGYDQPAQVGMASYYGHEFHGRKTASGEIYNENKLTAAHPRLPFGSKVKVINLSNSKSVVVRINDRGPFVSGRIIDLSYRAAQVLEFVNRGTAKVKVEIVEQAQG
ncbi:MAG: septal ring lytic transglycosylase RlpA family protein [candidate division Zixibacteria bacterium]|nr:septal ring lytic transglycosylase RlpA family protein [candidate division Zixibacteria bacterium]